MENMILLFAQFILGVVALYALVLRIRAEKIISNDASFSWNATAISACPLGIVMSMLMPNGYGVGELLMLWVISYLLAFFFEASLAGWKTDQAIAQRRQGELAATWLNESDAVNIIIRELQLCPGCWRDDPKKFLRRVLTPGVVKRIQTALGNVPLTLSGSCMTIGDILLQAVRYPGMNSQKMTLLNSLPARVRIETETDMDRTLFGYVGYIRG